MVENRKIQVLTFLIKETNGEAKMRNINPSVLQHLYGLTTKYLGTFMFEFTIVYRTYDYTKDE